MCCVHRCGEWLQGPSAASLLSRFMQTLGTGGAGLLRFGLLYHRPLNRRACKDAGGVHGAVRLCGALHLAALYAL